MDLNRIAREVFRKAAAVEMEAPARIVTRQSQLMRSALALIKIFFGNQQDFREGVGKLKMLMTQGMTGITTQGMTPEQIGAAAAQVAKSIWVKFNNAIPSDIQFRVAVMRQALFHVVGALFGAEMFKRNTFAMLDRKLGIDVEELGYTGDAKEALFGSLYMALRQAIKSAAPAAVGKVSSERIAAAETRKLTDILDTMGLTWIYRQVGMGGMGIVIPLGNNDVSNRRWLEESSVRNRLKQLAEKTNHKYYRSIGRVVFEPENEFETKHRMRKRIEHRGLEIIEPMNSGDMFEVPDIKADFVTLAQAKHAIDKMYGLYLEYTDEAEEAGDFPVGFIEWLSDYEVEDYSHIGR
jgi:hypothetical protein